MEKKEKKIEKIKFLKAEMFCDIEKVISLKK